MKLIALVAALAFVGAVGCKKESDSGTAEKGDKSEKKDKSWGKCKYLSLKDASKLTGHPMKNLSQEDKEGSAECAFETADEDNTMVKINVNVYTKSGDGVWDNCKKGKKISPAIGDEARDDDGRVCVKKGDTIATVYSMVYGIEKDEQEQVTRRIAKRVSNELE